MDILATSSKQAFRKSWRNTSSDFLLAVTNNRHLLWTRMIQVRQYLDYRTLEKSPVRSLRTSPMLCRPAIPTWGWESCSPLTQFYRLHERTRSRSTRKVMSFTNLRAIVANGTSGKRPNGCSLELMTMYHVASGPYWRFPTLVQNSIRNLLTHEKTHKQALPLPNISPKTRSAWLTIMTTVFQSWPPDVTSTTCPCWRAHTSCLMSRRCANRKSSVTNSVCSYRSSFQENHSFLSKKTCWKHWWLNFCVLDFIFTIFVFSRHLMSPLSSVRFEFSQRLILFRFSFSVLVLSCFKHILVLMTLCAKGLD